MTNTLSPAISSAPPSTAQQTTPPPTRARRHLHIGIKLLLLLLYGALLVTTRSLGQLLLDADLLLLASIVLLLPPRTLYVPITAALAAEVGLYLPHAGSLTLAIAGARLMPFAGMQGVPVAAAQAVALALCKVLCIAQVVAVFSLTTPVPELLRVFSAGVFRLPGINTLAYLLSTTLAVLPSVQRDLRKSLEVAILRRGSRRTLLRPSTWTAVVLDLLVRTVLRSQRLGDAVADRGFNLAHGLTPLPGQWLRPLDVLLGVALAVPGLVVYRMML